MVANTFDPRKHITAVLFLGQSCQLLLQTCKKVRCRKLLIKTNACAYNDDKVFLSSLYSKYQTTKHAEIVPFATCQTSTQCFVVGIFSLTHFRTCTCRSVTKVPMVTPAPVRREMLLIRPSFSIWQLLFTSLLC